MTQTMQRPYTASNPDPAKGFTTRGKADETSFLNMKAEHLKKKGDEALKRGNFREAYTKYTECLGVKPDKHDNEKIYSNRSQAYYKAMRYEESLADANTAISLNPSWPKAYWRAGEAHWKLGDYPGSLRAFKAGWDLDHSNREFEKKLWWTIERHTREQVAEGILALIQSLEDEGLLDRATEETVAKSEMVEAFFKQIYVWHLDKPSPGDYYKYYLRYVKEGLNAGFAYMERAFMYTGAKCFLQAIDYWEKLRDSGSDLTAYKVPRCLMDQPGTTRPFKWLQLNPLGLAFFRLGEAWDCGMERDHPDCRLVEATKAYTRAVDLDHDSTEYQGHLGDAGSCLSNKQMAMVLSEIYNEAGKHLENPIMCGIVDKPDGNKQLWRCEGMVRFPNATPRLFNAAARNLMRCELAEAAGLDKLKVMIDKVRPPNLVAKDGHAPALEVHFQVQVGDEKARAEALIAQFQSDPLSTLGGAELSHGKQMGPVDLASATLQLVDITPIIQQATAEEEEEEEEEAESSDEDDWYRSNELVIAARPKMDLELPYRSYKLVYTNGMPVERVDKHPFCMSRVYYDKKEQPKEVWAQMSDGTCCWRQSADEVAVMVLKVPPGTMRQELEVKVEMRYIKVANRKTGEVYMEGRLYREIIPEESVWTTGDGVRDEGFMMYLKKMNLELYQKHWEHNRMWWQQLYDHHAQIVWDDYDKDYSDLPAPIMEEYRRNEALQDETRHLEHTEREHRQRLQDKNDLRRRKRQERLNELRGGPKMDWVLMDRERPAEDPLKRGGVPGGRDR